MQSIGYILIVKWRPRMENNKCKREDKQNTLIKEVKFAGIKHPDTNDKS